MKLDTTYRLWNFLLEHDSKTTATNSKEAINSNIKLCQCYTNEDYEIGAHKKKKRIRTCMLITK